MKNIFAKWNSLSLVFRIICGIIVGVVLALVAPSWSWLSILGTLFIGALKSVAPVLVFVLVTAAIAGHRSGNQTNMKTVIILYAVATIAAGATAVIAAKLFPTKLHLKDSAEDISPPSGIGEVLQNILTGITSNPIEALGNANYLAILAWAIALGVALRMASDTTKTLISNLSDAVSKVVQWVINLAPFGIIGIVYDAIVTNGLGALKEYGHLIIVLVGTMLFVALVVNPLIVFLFARRNPYPLVLTSLRESGITAFFTRSSAANIPVNMKLAEKLGLDKDTYAVSIPLGATVNMGGAAVTISVLSLATAHTLGIDIDIPTAILLMLVAAVSAAGASGVAGGSLLLIPLACSLFGVPGDVAAQVIAIGMIIGVVQDSCETALNSSTDIVFTATAEYAKERKTTK
ncbi:serine/threonine transporter SstT [Kurthia massiliensis]|uniref:serine/threonine transporter SstT n=1 Tax=Kurthia massiliensis TaxID=1033739 RepID=UPI00028A28BB|nr:serine/threonine transporter SstT [Kurthia massiliensis]